MKTFNQILSEASLPNQGKVLSTISKGLGDVPDITSTVGMALWHFLNPAIVGKGGIIYKSGKSIKIMDELWHRIGRSVEASEKLTPKALTKLKKNFFSLSSTFQKIYQWNAEKNRWEGK